MSDTHSNGSVIEAFSVAKSPDESKNEDGLFINEHFIAVVDGTTSKIPALYSGKTGGQLLKDAVIDALGKLTGSENHVEAISFIQKNILETKRFYQIDYAAASAIIYSKRLKQIWSVGDCRALIDSVEFCTKHGIDDILAEVRSYTIRALLKQGYTVEQLRKNDLGRQMIFPALCNQRLFENSEEKYGYFVLNTDEPPKDPSVITSVYPVRSGQEIVLASDGYPVLKNTLAQSEKALEEIITKDPLLYDVFLATKGVAEGNLSFDDRTYVRFTVN